MEVSSTVRTPLQGVREGLDSSSAGATAPLEQRDHHPRPLVKVPQKPIFKQRDHRSLPPLQIPQRSNRFPLQLLYPEKKDPVSPSSSPPRQGTYRHTGGEVYKSAQALVPRPETSKQSRSTISDSNFLQLIQSAASSNEDLAWSDDQSPTSSGSTASTIRESLPAYVLENTQDGTDSLQLRRFTLSWTTASMWNALKEKQWGNPIAPAECGMQSTFREKFLIDENAPKLGQKALDDGFDVAIFMLSTRIYGRRRKQLSGLIPYKLRASQSVALEYSSANAVSVRRRLAWIQLCTALDPRSANDRLSREFEEVSADFFGGRPVEAEYGDGFATFSHTPKPYNLRFKDGDRTKVLEEQPLANNSVAIFLGDVIMANQMEEARVQNETYQNGLRVYRHQSYMEVYNNLQNARKEQEKYTYYDLTKGVNSVMTLELRKVIMKASSDFPEQKIGILEVADGGGRASISGYMVATEVSSTAQSVSQEQGTTLAGTSTVVRSTGTSSPTSLASKTMLNVRNTSAGPSLLTPSTTKEPTNGSTFDSSPTSNKVQLHVGASQAAAQNDEAMVVGGKDTKSAPELSNTKKSKKGSKRKRAKKCKAVENTDRTCSAQPSHSLDYAELVPEQHLGLGIDFEPEAHPRTQHGSRYLTASEYDGKWNEVKPKLIQKARNCKQESFPAFPKTAYEAPFSVQIESGDFREFKPEEYPALSSEVSTLKAAGNNNNSFFAASASATKLPSNTNMSWEETVRNLPPENIDAVRPLTQKSQTSFTPESAHLDSEHVSVVETDDHQPQIAELIPNAGENHVEGSGEALDVRGTGLEWAAAELSSPTKFKSSWRHSSLPYRSTTPSQDDFDQSAEKSTTRLRSNTTAVLDPRVRAVQFGDFPVALQETAESTSVANSGHSNSPPHSAEEAATTYHVHAAAPNYIPMFANSFPLPSGFSTTPVPAQMHPDQPHHVTPMFMPTPYPPPGFFVPGPGLQVGFNNPHSVPYGVYMPPGFSHPPRPVVMNGSDYISTRARPTPAANEYSPSRYIDAGVPSQNQYPVDQASQDEGEHDGSFSGQSNSDESSGGSSDNNQEPGQPTNAQGPTAIAGYTCSCCHKGYFPSVQRPLYFCAGCGPTCAIRYCSAACLLADAYYHTHHCSQYAHYMRVDPHNMPGDIYEYERFYLAPCELRTPQETPERFRQRQFAMYCFHGPFPQILRAWAEQHELPVGLTGCDINESFKKTGDYHIFRSEVSADGKKFAPCEVICTLRLRNGDPMKEALTRVLNVCLIFLQPRVIKFLFRLIRHLILDLDNWSLMMPVLDQRTVYAEFIHQFSLEFSFDAKAHTNDFSRFDLTEEWRLIRLDMEDLEMQFQVLRCWYRAKSERITPPLEPRN